MQEIFGLEIGPHTLLAAGGCLGNAPICTDQFLVSNGAARLRPLHACVLLLRFRPLRTPLNCGCINVSERFWTLDPIDGTKGFLRREQYALWSASIAIDTAIDIAIDIAITIDSNSNNIT